jgi:hypothetical protein
MADANGSQSRLRAEAARELRLLLIISTYLYVCFSALLFFKAAILHGEGIGFAPWGIAVVKAVVLAKFIMIGEALHVGNRMRSLPLIWATAYKAGVFLAFLIVLTLIEEAVIEVLHGHRAAPALAAEFGGARLTETVASCIVLLLILIPFFTYRGFDAALGKGALLQLLLARPAPRS